MNGVSAKRLEQATSLPEIFEIVKDLVRKRLGRERAGLMLGLSNLGGGRDGLVGGFFQVASNMIVMNTMPLQRIRETQPELYKPYAFHILLHEYLHTIGFLDEPSTRRLTAEITAEAFGDDHLATQLTEGWQRFFDNLTYPVVGWQPQKEFNVEVVRGFDPGATSYIQ